MRVSLLYTLLALGFTLNSWSMQSGIHKRTRSMPLALQDGGTQDDGTELVSLAAARDLESGSDHDTLFLSADKSMGECVHEPGVTVRCAERALACGKKSGRWLYDHKGTLVLLTACGVACFYAGKEIAKVTNTCSNAQDTCADAVAECSTAVELLHACTQEVVLLREFAKGTIANGTRMFAGAVQECLATIDLARQAYALCKLCGEGIPIPALP